jgi:hypothetical protein
MQSLKGIITSTLLAQAQVRIEDEGEKKARYARVSDLERGLAALEASMKKMLKKKGILQRLTHVSTRHGSATRTKLPMPFQLFVPSLLEEPHETFTFQIPGHRSPAVGDGRDFLRR